jgi:uncharacterized protein YggL (DUF469 family)
MKKRIRKKRRLGEFRQWGFEIKARVIKGADIDTLTDDFVSKVEELGCYCGGGIGPVNGVDMVVELGRDKGDLTLKRDNLVEWAKNRPEVFDISFGPFVDLWHEPSYKSPVPSMIISHTSSEGIS